ncbi:MAG: hypothetical protein NXI10_12780 [bacterium]|nr:hypothetical protein [bacterium]
MKTTHFTATILLLSVFLFSCGNEEANGEKTDPSKNEVEKGTKQDEVKDLDGKEPDDASENTSKEEDLGKADYFISLESEEGEFGTGMSKGKTEITDGITCTLGDWTLKFTTAETNPKKMVGNIYMADLESDQYSAQGCTCQIMNMKRTDEKNEQGQKVKLEGEIVCDEGEVYGTFVVPMIQKTN